MKINHKLMKTFILPIMALMALIMTATGQLPSPWVSADIGSVGVAGSASYDSGTATFTLKGSGSDIWGNSDSFFYVYQPATGDCEMKCRVTGVQNTSGFAKDGVMIRESLNADSTFAIMMITPANGASGVFGVKVGVAVGVNVAVAVLVGVAVAVGVQVAVGVAVDVPVAVGV